MPLNIVISPARIVITYIWPRMASIPSIIVRHHCIHGLDNGYVIKFIIFDYNIEINNSKHSTNKTTNCLNIVSARMEDFFFFLENFNEPIT